MKKSPQSLFFVPSLILLLFGCGCDGWGAIHNKSPRETEPGDFEIQRISFLLDADRSLDPNEILNPRFSRQFYEFRYGIPSFGFSPVAVWCRIDLVGRSQVSVMAELASTRLDHVTWFEIREGERIREVSNGWRDNGWGKAALTSYPCLPIELDSGQSATILFRVTSECAITLPISVLTTEEHTRLSVRRSYVAHLQVGASLAVVAICILLGFAFRDMLFILLGLCCASGFMYGVFYDPVLSLQTFSISPAFSRVGCSIAAIVASIMMIMFCGVYCQLRNLNTFDRRLLLAASLLTVALLPLHLVISFRILNQILGLFLGITECCGIWIISSPWRNKRESADFQVLVWVLLIHFPALLFILQLQQMIPTYLPPQSLRFIALPTIVSGLVCVPIRRRQSAERLRVSTAQARAGESEARLAALRFQLNPHMLLKCLTAVSVLALTAPERIPALIDNLATILRSRLKPAPRHLWTLAEELQLARALVELENLRSNNSVAFQESLESDAETYLLPEMLLQPLIENALKDDGAESEPASITLHASVDTDRLVVTISNNKASNTTGKVTHGFGSGIANIRQRLELLYGRRAEFKMVEEDRCCQVTITFPAIRQH